MNDLISIIVPVYNNERTILRCLSSIYNQDWKNKEIIIIDDGSTDGSYSICEEFKKSRKNILLLKQQHAGASRGRNYGLDCSNGSYICFCDADDELLPFALTRMINIFDEDIDLVVGNVLKKKSPVIKRKRIKSRVSSLQMFFRHDEKRLLGSVYGKLFRHSLIGSSNCSYIRFDETIQIGEDALFLLEYLLRSRKIYLTTDVVYLHNINSNGIISSYNMANYLTALDASEKMIREVQSDEKLKELAINDLFWTFIKVLKKFSLISDGEIVKKRFESILSSLAVVIHANNVPFYSTSSHRKLTCVKQTLCYGSSPHNSCYNIDASNLGIAALPALSNMHIHLEDYYTIGNKEYNNTEEFLKHKVIDTNINENIKRNLKECEKDAALFAVYTHKKQLFNSLIHVLCQSKECDDLSNEGGWMLSNILSYSHSQIDKVFSLSKELNRPVFFHLSSTPNSDKREREKFGDSFILYLSKKGLLSKYCFIVHGCYLNSKELTEVSKNRANIIICPLAEHCGHEKILDIDELSKYNIVWMLGSDSQALTNTSSLLQNALFLQKRYGDEISEELFYHISHLPVELSQSWEIPIVQQFVLVDTIEADPYKISPENIIKGLYKPICKV